VGKLHEEVLKVPHVRAFLDMISAAEGTTKYSYRTMVGGARIADLSQHPRRVVNLGNGLYSTAAGRYQFLWRTWNGLQTSLGLPNFGERSQDIAAVELLRRRGALTPLLRKDFRAALSAARKEWASFPGAGYGQGERSIAYMTNAFNASLARIGGAANTIIAGAPPLSHVKDSSAVIIVAVAILLLLLKS
jgi:muramidase (phage lysozyme)